MKLYLLLLLLSSFSFAQTSLKSKEKLRSIKIFEKIIKEFNIDSKKKYMEVYEDSKELGLPPLSKLSQIYPEWEGWNEPSPKKDSSDWVKKELRKMQEHLNESEEFGGNEEFEEEFEEKNSPTKKEKKIIQKKNPILKRSSEKNNLAPYEELKKILIDQGVKSIRDYRLLREKNGGVINGWRMPSNPNTYYGDEWKDWGEFLGKPPISPYEELKKALIDQEIKSAREYFSWREKNKGVFNGWRMPRNPHRHYGNKWESWNEFFGKKPSLPFAPYEELKKILIDQGIKKSREYLSWREKNKGVFNGWKMPGNPHTYYDEWEGWGNIFGKLPLAPYEELKKAVIDQGIKTSRHYYLLREKNGGVINGWSMPSSPHTYYDEWEDWPKFFNECETAFKKVSHR